MNDDSKKFEKLLKNRKFGRKKIENERKNHVKICNEPMNAPILSDLDRFQGQIDEAGLMIRSPVMQTFSDFTKKKAVWLNWIVYFLSAFYVKL